MQRIGDIDIRSLAGMRHQQAATLRVLAWVGGFGQRRVMRVPAIQKGVAALLDPSVKIRGGDGIRPVEQRMRRGEQLHRSSLVHHALRHA